MFTLSLFNNGLCQVRSNAPSSKDMHRYMSFGTEYFKWNEYVSGIDDKYVAEHGPRLHVNLGADNYLDVPHGLLKAWNASVMFGVVHYKGSTLDDKENVPNGTLKGKTYYNGYALDLTRGYRYRASKSISLDVKGTLGGQAWLRNIRSDNVYIARKNTTRQYTAVEVSLQPYAKTALAANWYMTPELGLSLEGGVLYPIKTWTHCDEGNVWLEPEAKLAPFTGLSVNINRNIFVKANYIHQKFGKSAEKHGDLNGKGVGYYQPATTTSTLSLDIGYYF